MINVENQPDDKSIRYANVQQFKIKMI